MSPNHAAHAASVADPAANAAAVAATVSALNDLALALRGAGEVDAARSTWTSALRLAPGSAALHANLGALLQDLGQHETALRHYEQARTAAPDWVDVWNNSGILLRRLGRIQQARDAFQQALELDAGHVAARYNLGNLLLDASAKDQAAEQFRRVLTGTPGHAEAHYGLASCLQDPLAAIAGYEAALQLRPDFPEALVGLACARLRVCDWRELESLHSRIESLVQRRPEAPVAPFSFLQISANPILQRQCARNWSLHRVPQLAPLAPRTPEKAGPRLRVGYLSGDFRDHAVGHLVCDLPAAHDRDAFEVFAYGSGPDDGSSVRRCIEAGADRFVDASTLDDGALAQPDGQMRSTSWWHLRGNTDSARRGGPRGRPAPVQISYLGYPGSLGSPFVDYVIADAFLTPPAAQVWYDERVLEMPHCYQVSPDWNVDSSPAVDRAALGLPADAFVFACFNNPYKIRPDIFDAWMHILRKTPGSVLWLPAFNDAACANLRREALARGVTGERLVFAPLLPFDQHSARLPAADLFLDTHPYSAGATANKTLASGVPLLTMVGQCYVSRMAGSVLHALGLDELVVDTLEAYVGEALRMAHDPVALCAIRERLFQASRDTRLFTAATGARALEAAYRSAWQALGDDASSTGVRS
ncbi:MAG: tetratricopeptide repeat protein [Burkholderiales bacterium]|nr:tetratricopeptide repeat protein [Burkholderiales bacterium]